ncbi:TonB-dependent receptor plug domain-containing protein [Methylococcus sp. S1B]|uniref:TonB-dependent receptor plug domain-containing protein n=1 Tax=Methylococcus sp. S1B TaxID=3435347 RepID=UPI003D7C580B
MWRAGRTCTSGSRRTPAPGTWHLTWGGEGWYEDGSTPDGRYRSQRATGAAVGRLEMKSDRYSGVVGFRTDSYEQYGVHTTFHAGSQYRILPEFAVFADGGIGYRLPSFPELLTPFIGNPELRPEHGASGQAGFNWDVTGSTQLSLTGYYNRFDDLIILARLPIGLYRSENIPRTRIMGLEMQGATAWNAQFSSGIDYTLTSNENLDTGDPLPHRPDNIGRFWTEWRGQTWPLRLWTEAIYRGPSYSDGRNIYMDDALLINMTLNYVVDPRLTLYVRGENITNNQTSDTYILGVPGAAVYGGIRAGLP